jgi:hypothetical protein
MNERIRELVKQAGGHFSTHNLMSNPVQYRESVELWDDKIEKFAELIVKECCLALWTEECHTSDLAFDEVKRNATRIKEHFGIDPKEITEAMLDRSIKWMEQQLADKKHFGVEE